MGRDADITLASAVQQVQTKSGRTLLTDEEIMLLMADALSRTTTFEELRFLQPDGNHG